MARIVQDELEHFHLVIGLLQTRNIRFRRLPPGKYGKRLNELIRKQEPQTGGGSAVDCQLIEARSCERFDLLREHVHDRELAEFYGSLFESEARHHSTYVRLAKDFADDDAVRERFAGVGRRRSESHRRGG